MADGTVIIDTKFNLDKFKAQVAAAEKQTSSMASIGAGGLSKLKLAAAGAGLSVGALAVGAVKAGISYESAFAGVKKTVNATDAELNKMSKGIEDMSLHMPKTAEELAHIAEGAGQLGIKKEAILGFTKVMAQMSDATNLSSEEASMSLAKFANITGMSQKNFSNLGSAIVALGNSTATTEKDIVAMGMRIAGAGSQVGMTQAQIMSFSAGLSSVGIEAEAGGTAFSQLLARMNTATAEGGAKLQQFAQVAGMSSTQFKKAFKDDASGATLAFIQGLKKIKDSGGEPIQVLKQMGLSGIRMQDMLLRASNGSKIFSKALKTGNKAWRENTALSKEAGQRYQTTESKLLMLKNRFMQVGRDIYAAIKGNIRGGIDGLSAGVAAAGKVLVPLVTIIAKVASTALKLSPVLIRVGAAVAAVRLGKHVQDWAAGFRGLIASQTGATNAMQRGAAVAAATATQQRLATGITQNMTLAQGAARLATNGLTIATAGLRNVMAALGGPIGIFLMAATYLVPKFAGWIQGAQGASVATTQFSSAVAEQTRRARALASSVDSVNKKYKDGVADGQARAQSALVQAAIIQKLAKNEHKSAAAKKTIKDMVDKLNGDVKGLNASYNEQTDTLRLNNKTLKQKVAAMQEEARMAAAKEAMIAAYKAEFEAQAQLNEQTKIEKKLVQALAKARKEDYEAMRAGKLTSSESGKTAALRKELATVRGNINKTKDAYKKAGRAANGYADAILGASKKAGKAGSKTAKSAEKTAKTIKNANQKAQEGSSKSPLHKMERGVKSSASKVKKSLNKTVRDVFKTKKDVMKGGKGDPLKQTERSVKISANKMKAPLNYVSKAPGRAVRRGKNAADSASRGTDSIGANLMEGIGRGIRNTASTIYHSMKSTISDLIDAAKKAAGIKSPSRVMDRQVGRQLINGISQGIKKRQKSLNANIKNLIKGMLKVAGKNLNFEGIGKKFMVGLGKVLTHQKKLFKEHLKGLKKSLRLSSKELKKFTQNTTKQFNKMYAAILKKAEHTINKTAQKYNNLKEELISARKDLRDKFRAYEFMKDEDSFTGFEGLLQKHGHSPSSIVNRNLTTLKDYQKQLRNLKGRIPPELMNEIMGLDMAEAMRYSRKLNAMTDEELKTYLQHIEDEKRLQKEIHGEFYTNQRPKKTLTNLKSEIQLLEEYEDKYKQLEHLLPKKLRDDIRGMEKTDAIDFMTELLNLKPYKLRAYIKQYLKKEELAKSISDGLYDRDFKNLKWDFKTELEKAIKTFTKYAKLGGMRIMQALLAGLKKGGNLGGALKEAKKKLEREMRKPKKPKKPKRPKKPIEGALPTKKPSVRRGTNLDSMQAYGLNAGEAAALIKSAELAAATAGSPTQIFTMPKPPRASRREDSGRPVQIQTTVKLNGKVVAQELTPLIDTELSKRYRKY